MKLKDVKALPIMRTIDDVVDYGKRNYGSVPYPNYYGVKQQPPANIKKNWTEWKKECIRLFREDQPDAATKLIDRVAAITHTRFKYESDKIMYFIKHMDWAK